MKSKSLDERATPVIFPEGVSAEELYPRYLAAKKSVDDRALNRPVWDRLRHQLRTRSDRGPLRILELGAGIGTMIERVVDWGLVTGDTVYVAVDREAAHLQAARQRLTSWAEQRGERLVWEGKKKSRLRLAQGELSLTLHVAGVEELTGPSEPADFDLLIAHALLDLVDFHVLLPRLLPRLKATGLLYLSCNFDGETLFLPADSGQNEALILERYHTSMDARVAGSSRTGRRLLDFLCQAGLPLLAAGSSDWVVHPQAGQYPADEAFFLQMMIATVEKELAKADPPPGLAAWSAARLHQLARGELIFLARHLDLLAARQIP